MPFLLLRDPQICLNCILVTAPTFPLTPPLLSQPNALTLQGYSGVHPAVETELAFLQTSGSVSAAILRPWFQQ